jgi:hypothetical protein
MPPALRLIRGEKQQCQRCRGHDCRDKEIPWFGKTAILACFCDCHTVVAKGDLTCVFCRSGGLDGIECLCPPRPDDTLALALSYAKWKGNGDSALTRDSLIRSFMQIDGISHVRLVWDRDTGQRWP